MKKEMNNKGFSLVELIIVIAIMAVLIGVLAPQYLKYVKSSKISTDITNAEEIATAINTAVADEDIAFDDITLTGQGGTTIYQDGDREIKFPNSKETPDQTWTVTADAVNGVTSIVLSGETTPIWPDGNAYRAARLDAGN